MGGAMRRLREWNTLSETIAAITTNNRQGFAGKKGNAQIQALKDIQMQAEMRTPTQISELDRVLGGGLVHGSVTLIGGDPGIGKSTLLTQTLASLSRHCPVFMSPAKNLCSRSACARTASAWKIAACNCCRNLRGKHHHPGRRTEPESHRHRFHPDHLHRSAAIRPGGVAQVRESAAQLVRFAKQTGTALFLVGHVTKEGTLAGPRVLEHMVDTVLYFEGDPGERYRMIRAIKNRFGAVNDSAFSP